MPRRPAFTLVELLVVIAIIGVLMALLLPAVQATRESARAADCKNRMKQLATATLLHHNTQGYFPAARFAARPGEDDTRCGVETPSWLARVLPYLEEDLVTEHMSMQAPWYLQPEHVRTYVPEVFICPSRRTAAEAIGTAQIATTDTIRVTVTLLAPCGCPYLWDEDQEIESMMEIQGAVSDYAGNHGDLSPGSTGAATDWYWGGNGSGVLISARPLCKNGLVQGQRDRLRMKSVTDGTTKTILLGEKYVPADGVGKPPYDIPSYAGDNLAASTRLAGPGLRLASGPTDPMATDFSFGSWHRGVTHFAMVDGSVQSLANETDTRVLGSLASRFDARVVELAN